MPKILEKVERRLGEKLFLKGERCIGPKCAVIKRSYPPGVHGKSKKKKRASSEYGQLLREKQKVRFFYGLDDRDIERYSKKAAGRTGLFNSELVRLIESRLDNAVFRLGFADSRRSARMMVSHGHIIVNGKTVTIPSYRLKKGEEITIKEASLVSPLFTGLDLRLKKIEAPPWLNLDKIKKVGIPISLPEAEDLKETFEFAKIKEFYSR